MKITSIKNFKEGDQITGFFLCKSVENKITRLGDEYLDLILEDQSGSIKAKIWSFIDTFRDRVKEGAPLAIKGKIITFNNNFEINISSANVADKNIYGSYGYNEDLLVKTIAENRDKLFTEVMRNIDSLSKDYKKIINKIFKDNHLKIKSIPSSFEAYGLKGGYLKQLVNVLKINKKIFPLYKDIDYNLILSGIIIKNIGFINYFDNDILYSVSDENENLGYGLLGVNLINDYCNQYVKFPVQIKTELQNIILSEDFSNEIHINYINSIYNFEYSIYSSINQEE